MPDMLGGDDKDDRHYDHDRLHIKFWSSEVWDRKDRGSGNCREINDSACNGSDISGDHGDQDRDDR